MARILASKDASYGYFRSGDNFAIPAPARELIKRNHGEFSGDTKTWRVPLHRAGDVITALRVDGHTVITPGSGQQTAKLSMLECRECRAPYKSAAYEDGAACYSCGASPLSLEPVHECGPECADNARSTG